MSYSVGQVAGFAGVTVRTLHHYDEIGLLSPERAQPRGLPALRRRRPRPAAADPVLPGARLPARRGRGPARRPGRGPAGAPAPPARAADRPDREAAEDGRGRRTRHGGTEDGHQPHARGEVRGLRGQRPGAVRRGGRAALGRHGRLRRVAAPGRRATPRRTGSGSRPRSPDWGDRYDGGLMAGRCRPDAEAAMDMAEEHRQQISRWYYDCTYEIHRASARCTWPTSGSRRSTTPCGPAWPSTCGTRSGERGPPRRDASGAGEARAPHARSGRGAVSSAGPARRPCRTRTPRCPRPPPRSHRSATSAPRSRRARVACSTSRSMAWLRVSTSVLVSPLSSPPTIDFSPAPIWLPRCRSGRSGRRPRR